jgi:pimeloyl-ACP methyl ester carboxylesterase
MRLVRLILALLFVACAGFLLVYRIKDPEKRTLDDKARGAAPGRFVRLADGITHYETAGPDTGYVVVLAAAFSVPAYLSDSLFQRLGRDGFRVLRFDYYGRGWSDRPDTTHELDLFGRQLAGLLDSLRITEPVDLVGLSFGAAIVTNFADRFPDRVRSLIYVNPVFNTGRQLPPRERTALAWDWYMVFRGGSEDMATGQLYDFLHPERHPDWVARYRVQQQFKGLARRGGALARRSRWRRIRMSRPAESAHTPGRYWSCGGGRTRGHRSKRVRHCSPECPGRYSSRWTRRVTCRISSSPMWSCRRWSCSCGERPRALAPVRSVQSAGIDPRLPALARPQHPPHEADQHPQWPCDEDPQRLVGVQGEDDRAEESDREAMAPTNSAKPMAVLAPPGERIGP